MKSVILDEVERIYQDAVTYWKVLKDKIQKSAHDFAGREYRSRAREIVRTMAEVYKNILGVLGVQMQDEVRRMLDEMWEMDIDTTQLKILFLTETESDEIICD